METSQNGIELSKWKKGGKDPEKEYSSGGDKKSS